MSREISTVSPDVELLLKWYTTYCIYWNVRATTSFKKKYDLYCNTLTEGEVRLFLEYLACSLEIGIHFLLGAFFGDGYQDGVF